MSAHARKFQVVGNSLVGPNLSFDVTALVDPPQEAEKWRVFEPGREAGAGLEPPEQRITPAEFFAKRRKIIEREIVEIASVVYREGRASVLMSHDDRFDLHIAVDTLRALAVVVGPSATGERHRRAADVIARLLQEQEA